MRRIFTTLIIVLGFYSLSSAQGFYGPSSATPQKGSVEFGFNIGLNSAYVQDANSNQHTDGVAGLNVGVSAETYFSDQWGLKLKVIYDQKGWANGYLDFGDVEEDGVVYKLNYITVPLMADWHFGRSKNWYLDFGPYVGFLTSANAGGYDVKSAFNTVVGGISLGLGVKIPISNKAKFFIEYEGQGGVSNVFQETSDGSNVQNVRGSLNIGVNF